MDSRPNPIRIFDESVAKQLQRDLGLAILRGYQDNEDYVSANFPYSVAQNLRPQHRYAVIEREIAAVAMRHDAIVTPELNAAGNYYHNSMRVGQVVITASCVVSPSIVPRDAVYRQTMARRYQASFLDPYVPPAPDDLLYAILIHGPDDMRPDRPAFIQIGFPDPECNQWVERIDLIARFDNLVVETIKTPVEEVPSDLGLRLRQQRRASEGED